jgi:hypothetical protein
VLRRSGAGCSDVAHQRRIQTEITNKSHFEYATWHRTPRFRAQLMGKRVPHDAQILAQVRAKEGAWRASLARTLDTPRLTVATHTHSSAGRRRPIITLNVLSSTLRLPTNLLTCRQLRVEVATRLRLGSGYWKAARSRGCAITNLGIPFPATSFRSLSLYFVHLVKCRARCVANLIGTGRIGERSAHRARSHKGDAQNSNERDRARGIAMHFGPLQSGVLLAIEYSVNRTCVISLRVASRIP